MTDLRPAAEVAREVVDLWNDCLAAPDCQGLSRDGSGPCPECVKDFKACLSIITARDLAVAERVREPFLDLQVCSRCCEVSPEHTGSLDPSWHCGGDYWEHKCPDVHAQVGHLPTVPLRALDPAKILEVSHEHD